MHETTTEAPPEHWSDALSRHLRLRPWLAAGLALASALVVIMLAQSLFQVAAGNTREAFRLAMVGGAAALFANALGALPALVVRALPQHLEDSLLGFAAGMMLAASSFSLLMPGLEEATRLSGNTMTGSLIVVAGMALGVMLMLGLDGFTPHEHDKTGPCGPGYELCTRLLLLVLAIALHNLPEGMAIGVSFAQADLGVGVPLTTAIAIQNIPEGLAVAIALRSAGVRPAMAVLLSIASGLLEPLGAIIGVGLSTGWIYAYPIGLGLAGGAMIFVVSHEVIPETHRNGHQRPATTGLMTGFAVMMVLNTVLG